MYDTPFLFLAIEFLHSFIFVLKLLSAIHVASTYGLSELIETNDLRVYVITMMLCLFYKHLIFNVSPTLRAVRMI